MYAIERLDYGLKVTSTGAFTVSEVEQLRADLLRTIEEIGRPFSVLIDARGQYPVDPDVRVAFHELHTQVWASGCRRIAFVLQSPVTKGQVKQMHHAASPFQHDRIIDAAQYPDWERRAVDWVADGIEPEEGTLAEPVSAPVTDHA